MFREGWISINSVPTHVMTWGGWIEDNIKSDSILVCVPGNPGITDFYYYFLERLHTTIGIPIWIINHAGMEPPPDGVEVPSISENPHLYDLAGQVEYEKTFIQNYVPKDKKLYLIGHSVGGKICAELMKDEKIASRTSQVHFIFPTLQHISESPNGKLFTSYGQYITTIMVSLAWVVSFIPRFFKLKVIQNYFQLRGAWKTCHQESCLEGTLKLITKTSARVALFLAKDEMYKIKDLDSEIYEKYYDKIFVYFAPNDRWAPVSQFHSLMEKHPKIRGEVLDNRFTHTFVLTTPADMAVEISKNVLPELKI